MKKIVLFFMATLFVLASCNDDKNDTNTVVFVSWGGSYQNAQDSAYLRGFEKEYNIHVRQISYSGELPKISEMVSSGKTTWDVVSVTQEMFSKGIQSNLFQDLNYDVIDSTNFIQGSIYKQGIAHLIFSTVMAYNTDYYQTQNRPTNWNEFWDVKNFPGNRALNDGPVGNLEFALIADGVPQDELYPLDVNRAFKKLDEIKPYIKVWWKEGQQPIQLLISNDVQISTAYNGRVSKAQSDGEPIGIEWNGGMLEPEYFVIPKGAPNTENANALISYATKAAQQRKFVQIIPYGPTNLKALDSIPESTLAQLPDSKQNLSGQFLINGSWWSQNYDRVQSLWTEWRINKH